MTARLVGARAVSFGVLLGTLVLGVRDASAAGTEAHRALMVAGQMMRADGKLLRAKELLADCAKEVCDASADAECEGIRAFCRQRESELAHEIPSVRVVVVDERGTPLPTATKRVGSLDVEGDAPLQLDPGRHVLRAEYYGIRAVVDFEVAKGGGERRLEATIDLRRSVVVRPVPWPVYALGIGAGISLASFAGFAIASNAQASSLDACKPTCVHTERAGFEATTIAADVSLGVAILAGLGAAVTWLARPRVVRLEHVDPATSVPDHVGRARGPSHAAFARFPETP